jgi:hypothetical protein
MRSLLEEEGFLFFEDGRPGSIVRRHFRAPGRYASHDWQGFRGALWITQKRLVVWSSNTRAEPSGVQVDVGFGEELFDALEISVEGKKVLISFDVSAFHPDWHGYEEVRMQSPKAAEFLEMARKRRSAAKLRM